MPDLKKTVGDFASLVASSKTSAATSVDGNLSILKIAQGESVQISMHPTSPFHGGVVCYVNEEGYYQFASEEEAEIALHLKAGDEYVALSAYNIVAREVQMIFKKASHINDPNTMLGAVATAFQPEKMGNCIIELTHSATKRNSYTAILMNDFHGVDNGHEKIADFVQKLDNRNLVSEICSPIYLPEFFLKNPGMETKYRIYCQKNGIQESPAPANGTVPLATVGAVNGVNQAGSAKAEEDLPF